jgi:spore germination cell wall hydrolase CwlJ-like protein
MGLFDDVAVGSAQPASITDSDTPGGAPSVRAPVGTPGSPDYQPPRVYIYKNEGARQPQPKLKPAEEEKIVDTDTAGSAASVKPANQNGNAPVQNGATAPAIPALSERDRTILIRTVLGEAASEPDDGQRAVAAVILNRLNGGKYGSAIPQVVTAKGQFEPWADPKARQRMLGYAPDSPEFTRAAANVDAILSGSDTDPTRGATYFYAPKAQEALGRQAPKFAQGEPVVIGRHHFYAAPGAQPAQVASNDAAFVPQVTASAGTPNPAAPAPQPQGKMFDDVGAPQPDSGGVPFNERFSGQGFGAPSVNAPQLASDLRSKADKQLLNAAYEGEPSQGRQTFDTIVERLANTFLLNVPRNIGAAYIAHKFNVPFETAYDSLKSVEEARARQNPKSALVGDVGGLTAAIATLPEVKLFEGAGLLGRAGNAAVTGATYGATGELLDSKDPVKASIAAALGSVLGAVAAPVAEKIVGVVSKLWAAGKGSMAFLKPDGTLTDEALAATKEAGIDPALMTRIMQQKYAETFSAKGASAPTAREAAGKEFGVDMTRGEATNDYGRIASEQAMARDAKGPLAGKQAREFYEGRDQQITRAKSGIQERTAGSEPLVDSVNDAANTVGDAVRSKAASAKAQYKGQYDEALSKEGEFSDITFRDIGERIRREALKGDSPVIINDKTTPVAASAIQHLDANIGKVRIQDRAQPRSEEAVTAGTHQFPGEPLRVSGSTPGPDTIGGVNMQGVEQSRKELVSFYKAAKSSGNAEDIRAMRRIIAGFDNELETAISTGLFKGDDQALPALKEARKLFANYQKTFRSQGAGDSVGRDMQKIVERDATGGEIANLLYGKAAIGEKGDSVRLAGHLKSLLDPKDWAALRQGLWLRLTSQPEGVTDFGPQALGTRINKFLSGDGADMAKVLFSAKEIGEMRRFATVMKSITPPPGTINHSNTAYALMREMAITSGIGGGAFWLTNDPETAGALAALRIGGKLSSEMFRGAAAKRYFASGAPKAPTAPLINAARASGVAAGAAAAQAQ